MGNITLSHDAHEHRAAVSAILTEERPRLERVQRLIGQWLSELFLSSAAMVNLRLRPGSLDMRAGSLCPHPHRLYDGPPLFNFCSLQRPERLRGLLLARRNLLAHLGKPMADRRIGKGVHDGGIKLPNYARRRIPRRPQSPPDRHIEPWKSRLVHGRDVRGYSPAGLRGHCIGLDLAFTHLGERKRRLGNRKVGSARYQVEQGRSSAAVGHHRNMRTGQTLKVSSSDMRGAPRPRTG